MFLQAETKVFALPMVRQKDQLLRIELRQAEGVESASCSDSDIFLAFHRKRHGRGIDGSAHLEVPERFERGGIEGDEISLGVPAEDQTTCCR